MPFVYFSSQPYALLKAFVKPMTEEFQIKHKTIFLPNKNTFIDWHPACHYGLHF